MTRLGLFGATALSLSLVVATPVLAQQEGHGGQAGMRSAGGNTGGARMNAGPRMNSAGPRMNGSVGAQSNFRAGQANVGMANNNFAGRGNAQFAQRGQFAQRDGQFAQRGEFRGDRGRGFGRDARFAAGAAVAAGSAVAFGSNYGYYDDGYYDSNYYGDSYAYDDGATYDTGLPLVAYGDQPGPIDQAGVGGDASYCAQRYRSYDPASGTYLGFDGLRHPCE